MNLNTLLCKYFPLNDNNEVELGTVLERIIGIPLVIFIAGNFFGFLIFISKGTKMPDSFWEYQLLLWKEIVFYTISACVLIGLVVLCFVVITLLSQIPIAKCNKK